MTRQRVAILGGGVAGITAAFELTNTPSLREAYDVTVYQLGWRLGGKCASGRNADRGNRIEEHGLHIWGGFYENAFRLIQACYAELGRPAGAPLATWEDAFVACDDAVLLEEYGGHWAKTALPFPPNPFLPGDGTPLPVVWDVLDGAVSMLRLWWDTLWEARPVASGSPPSSSPGPPRFAPVVRLLAGAADAVFAIVAKATLRLVRLLAQCHRNGPVRGTRALSVSTWLLRHLRDRMWRKHVGPCLDSAGRRMLFMQVDMFTSLFTGIVDDCLVERGFDGINDEDFRAWLSSHGAQRLTLGGPGVRAAYDGAFSFLDGDPGRPDLAAGVAVHGLLRQLFTYKGAPFWKMQAGMGDTVFAPMMQVLERRGVRFEFFREVTGLHADPGGTAIEAIDLRHQAELRGERYRPLVDVKGLPCWPDRPDLGQLDVDEAVAATLDFEAPGGAALGPRQTLRRGEDFDTVVLAIPVAALPTICQDIVGGPQNNPRLGAMIDEAKTVMTQAYQLWLLRDLPGLGWDGPPAVTSTYVEPLDTYCDMSHLLPRETWPATEQPQSIGYFCGVFPDVAGEDQAQATERAFRCGLEFLRAQIGPLWPAAVTAAGSFDFSLLVGEGEGEARYSAQYWRANFEPSERYVQAASGSIGSRLGPAESGYDNLLLTGDWVRNGLDAGCVEAAVMSGIQAARAIHRQPRRAVGESQSWIKGGDDDPFAFVRS